MRPGLKIKLKRIENEIKLQDLAKDIGVSREYLRLIEAGKARNPSIEVMKKLSLKLGASMDELFS